MENENMNVQNSNEQNTNLNATNNGCNCGNGGMKALLIILTVAVLGLGSYFVYDKVIKKEDKQKVEDKTNNTGKTEEKITMNVEVKNNRLYVNGNMVDFYSAYKRKDFYVKENDFYACDENGYLASDGKTYGGDPYDMKYEALNGYVYASVSPCASMEYDNYFIDKDGKIVKSIGGNGSTSDIVLSGVTMFGDISISKVEGNSIFFNTYDSIEMYKDTCCSKIKDGHGNDVYKYVDKVTSLGNNEFRLDKAVQKYTYNDMVEINDYDCSSNISMEYYSTGDKSKEQYMDYELLFKEPYYGGYVFIRTGSASLDDAVKSVCIYENEKIKCFTNNVNEKNKLENYFGTANCEKKTEGFVCHNNKFTCTLSDNGRINCLSNIHGQCAAYVDENNNAEVTCY